MVLAAGEGAAGALEDLAERYRAPILAFVRRAGRRPEDAEDLTHDFFIFLVESKALGKADARRGRFRAFLATALRNFLANEADRRRARKRGGERLHLPLDVDAAGGALAGKRGDDPAAAFDRNWASCLLARALERLRREVSAKACEAFALAHDPVPLAYRDIAERLEMTSDRSRRRARRASSRATPPRSRSRRRRGRAPSSRARIDRARRRGRRPRACARPSRSKTPRARRGPYRRSESSRRGARSRGARAAGARSRATPRRRPSGRARRAPRPCAWPRARPRCRRSSIVRIALAAEDRALRHVREHGVNALLDEPPRPEHERDLAVDEEAAVDLRAESPAARVIHEEVADAALALDRERLPDDPVGDLEIAGSLRGRAQAHVREREHEEGAPHEVPLGVAPAHAAKLGLPQLGAGPELEVPRRERAGEGRDAFRRGEVLGPRREEEVHRGKPRGGGEGERDRAEEEALPRGKPLGGHRASETRFSHDAIRLPPNGRRGAPDCARRPRDERRRTRYTA